jgi:hypothetical protein
VSSAEVTMIGTIPPLPIYVYGVHKGSVTFILSGMSLEVSPVCLQFHQLVTFDVVSQDVKFSGVHVWRHLNVVVKEVKVHSF